MEWNVGGLGEVGDGKKIMRKLNFVPCHDPPHHPHTLTPMYPQEAKQRTIRTYKAHTVSFRHMRVHRIQQLI